MGLLNCAARFLGIETRASTIRSDAYFRIFFNMRGAGVGAVSPDEVLSAMAVATACVSRRSQGLASVPLSVHRNVGQSNAERAENHALYDVLNYSPNSYQSAFELREFLVRSHDLLWQRLCAYRARRARAGCGAPPASAVGRDNRPPTDWAASLSRDRSGGKSVDPA